MIGTRLRKDDERLTFVGCRSHSTAHRSIQVPVVQAARAHPVRGNAQQLQIIYPRPAFHLHFCTLQIHGPTGLGRQGAERLRCRIRGHKRGAAMSRARPFLNAWALEREKERGLR